MELSGETAIPAPRQKVWQALNDPEVLKGPAFRLERVTLALAAFVPGGAPSRVAPAS
jgi:uncharacterized protein YndB with AHSA1/START domain